MGAATITATGRRRRLPAGVFFAIAVLGAIGLLIATHWLVALGGKPALIAALAAVAWLEVFFMLGWRRSDEAVRAAHKSAMFWGGNLGSLAAIGLVALLGVVISQNPPRVTTSVSSSKVTSTRTVSTIQSVLWPAEELPPELLDGLDRRIPDTVEVVTTTREEAIPGGVRRTTETETRDADGIEKLILVTEVANGRAATSAKLFVAEDETLLAEMEADAPPQRPLEQIGPLGALTEAELAPMLAEAVKALEAGPPDANESPAPTTATEELAASKVGETTVSSYSEAATLGLFLTIGLVAGLVLTLMVQMAGYGLAWAGWWWTKR